MENPSPSVFFFTKKTMETRICISIVFYLKPKIRFIFCFALRYLSKLTSIVMNKISTTFLF